MANVMLYPCISRGALLMDLFVLCAACLKVLVICYGSVECGWRCSVGYTVYGLPKNVCFVPVIPVCIYMFLP